jgi:hypothetical protein
MDPATSAGNFFRALLQVDRWQEAEPTIAAHRVQHNADPWHYESYWEDAVAVTEAVSGTASLASCQDPSPAQAGDGLPRANAPFCPIGGACPPGAVSPLGIYNRECTDFALWRLNTLAGATGQPWAFHNADLSLGNASTWIDAWHRQGWDTGRTPRPGAVARYAPGTAGPGPLGHVAIVTAVNGDGTVTIEEYNGQSPPNDHRYGTRTLAASAATYLYSPA